MKTQSVGLRLTSLIFGIISLVQLARVSGDLDSQARSHRIGLFASLAIVAVTAVLGIWTSKRAGENVKAPQPTDTLISHPPH